MVTGIASVHTTDKCFYIQITAHLPNNQQVAVCYNINYEYNLLLLFSGIGNIFLN